MVAVLEPLLQRGRIKLYCPESNVSEAWTRKESPLGERMQKHLAYERFVLDTLVPFVRDDCRWADAPLAATGCSLGAMYAVNFALKHPDIFKRALGQGRIRRIEGLDTFMQQYGRYVVAEDLLKPGEHRRNWLQTLVSDGYLIVRHPDIGTTLRLAEKVATDVRRSARCSGSI
jgi:enterochelin esterase-like enzyme